MAGSSRRSILKGCAAAFAAAAFSRPHASVATSGAPFEHRVEIARLKFTPDRLRVRVGDTISWTNRDIAPHTATSLDRSWDTGRIDKDETKSIVVTADLSPAYFCRFHPNMKAHLEIVVND